MWCTHTAAGSDRNLDGVPPRLAYVLQVQGFVGGFVVSPLDGEGRGVDADLDGGGPVGVHLSVLVVVALKLQLKVGPVGAMGQWESAVCDNIHEDTLSYFIS